MHRNNLGILLAIVAGLLTVAYAVWPIVPPQARGDLGALWWLRGLVIAGAFVASAFLADGRTPLSRAILVAGALALIGTSLFTGTVREPGDLAAPAFVFDATPAIVALIAAALIGPIHRSKTERETQRSGARLPDQPVPLEQQVRPRRASDTDGSRAA